jgi:hypothetical protein
MPVRQAADSSSDRLWERSVQRNLLLLSLPGDRSYAGR